MLKVEDSCFQTYPKNKPLFFKKRKPLI